MLSNRYLIGALCILLVAVLGWNIRFFAGRRSVPGNQSVVVSPASSASRKLADAPARREFPVDQDAAVWRRDPFSFRPRGSAEKQALFVSEMPVKEDRIDLQGIMISGEKRYALVDGWVVGIGERVRDYSVIAINQYSIVLKGIRGTREVSIIHETVKEK